ncbi:hypothetical protein [Ideonella sp. B508-1]|uniref:hypothetical protein n=1 Tax=Ideonella sp. B508-1 TaxID=137716 RepID=UPI000345DECD|nr:hypothetical protein [Ideonella sp. B508-1]
MAETRPEEMTMKIQLTLSSPRNPVAVPARMRQAGPHRRSGKALRQQQQQALRRELAHARPDPHSP